MCMWLERDWKLNSKGESMEIQDMDKFFLFIGEADKDLEKGQSKVFICPICGGYAHAAKASNNGHLHAYCEKCKISIMQ